VRGGSSTLGLSISSPVDPTYNTDLRALCVCDCRHKHEVWRDDIDSDNLPKVSRAEHSIA
jgi:hypothetical protein